MLRRAGRLLIALFAVAVAGPAGAQPTPKEGGGGKPPGGWADEVRSAIGGAKGEVPRGSPTPPGGTSGGQGGPPPSVQGQGQERGEGGAKPEKR